MLFSYCIFVYEDRVFLSASSYEHRRFRSDELLKGTVDGRPYLGSLVKVDGGDSALADAFRRELEFLIARSASSVNDKNRLAAVTHLVHFFIGPAGTKSIQAELFM